MGGWLKFQLYWFCRKLRILAYIWKQLYEKQERQKEIAELEQMVSGSKKELSSILHQQIAAGQEAEQIRKEGPVGTHERALQRA